MRLRWAFADVKLVDLLEQWRAQKKTGSHGDNLKIKKEHLTKKGKQ